LLPEQFNNCYLNYLFIIIIIFIYYLLLYFFLKQYVKLKSENMGVYAIDSFFLLFLFIYFLKLANQVWKQLFVFIIIYYLFIFFIIFNIQILLF